MEEYSRLMQEKFHLRNVDGILKNAYEFCKDEAIKKEIASIRIKLLDKIESVTDDEGRARLNWIRSLRTKPDAYDFVTNFSCKES